jgi:hypothetical protein
MSSNSNPNVVVIFVFPFLTLVIFFLTLVCILHKTDPDSNWKSKFRILFYMIFQFLCLPVLLIFLLINVALIFASYVFCRKLVYISTKTIFDFFSSIFEKLKICNKCKFGSTEEVNRIKIKKKESNEIEELPERANKYKEVSNESGGANDPKNIAVVKQSNLHLNNDNNNEAVDKKDIFSLNPPNRPNINKKVKNKGKIFEFLSKTLLSEDNTPGYVTLLNNIKNKAKVKKENKNLSDLKNTVVINL